MDCLSLVALVLSGCLTASAFSHFDTECFTLNGVDYRGKQNVTSLHGGKPCLFWNETLDHPINTHNHPDGFGGLGPHNYCRNPDNDMWPWCYIAEQVDGSNWKYCEIETCRMPGFLGCFKDTGDPSPLAKTYETSKSLTVQNCIALCRNRRRKLAGMEAGYACFCGNYLDYDLHGEAPFLECSHKCFGDSNQLCGGDGHVIVFDTKVGTCGGNYTSETDVIYSPDFPDKYSPGRVCYWTIQVQGASVILFNFTFFDIKDEADMVELLDGHTHQVVARFDRLNPPRNVINITVNFVILYFYSDRTNESHGFSLIYQAFRSQSSRPAEEDYADEDEEATSTMEPHSVSTTEKSNSSQNEKSSQILYVITSSPGKPEHDMPVWTIYALAALLTLTVIAMVAKLLLHVTAKSPSIPSISRSESCSQNSSSEPWIIFYRPSTISLFKKKLKNHHGDLSPLVGN